MSRLQNVSQDLIKALHRRYEPVGVALYREGGRLPANLGFAAENLKSYCQAR